MFIFEGVIKYIVSIFLLIKLSYFGCKRFFEFFLCRVPSSERDVLRRCGKQSSKMSSSFVKHVYMKTNPLSSTLQRDFCQNKLWQSYIFRIPSSYHFKYQKYYLKWKFKYQIARPLYPNRILAINYKQCFCSEDGLLERISQFAFTLRLFANLHLLAVAQTILSNNWLTDVRMSYCQFFWGKTFRFRNTSFAEREKLRNRVLKVLFIIKVRSNFVEALKLSDIPFFRQKVFQALGREWSLVKILTFSQNIFFCSSFSF